MLADSPKVTDIVFQFYHQIQTSKFTKILFLPSLRVAMYIYPRYQIRAHWCDHNHDVKLCESKLGHYLCSSSEFAQNSRENFKVQWLSTCSNISRTSVSQTTPIDRKTRMKCEGTQRRWWLRRSSSKTNHFFNRKVFSIYPYCIL